MIILQAQLDDIKERERNWAITEDSADKIAGVETLGVKQPPNVSASSFVSEQNQKAAALERMRKDQEERLRSLSSPLPVKGEAPRYGGPATKNPAPNPVTPKGSSARQVVSLASMFNTGNQDRPEQSATLPTPPPPPQPRSPRLSLSEMTRLKKDPVPLEGKNSDVRIPSLAEMTRLKKDNNGGASRIGAASNTAAGRQPVRQQVPISNSDNIRRPIRQQILISSEDSENDDLLQSNKKMSIGEAMKRASSPEGTSSKDKEAEQKRSKMWGIDIDKLL